MQYTLATYYTDSSDPLERTSSLVNLRERALVVSVVCSLDVVILYNYIADIAGWKACIKKLVEKILSSVEESTNVGILDDVQSLLTKASATLEAEIS